MLHNVGSCIPDCAHTESHRNYLEQDAGGTIGWDVEFNTTYQSWSNGSQGGEGFQIYSNSGSIVFLNPVFSNNTMIARRGIPTPAGIQPHAGVIIPDTNGPTMSGLVHGPGGGSTVSGTGQNNNNYFDASGATAAYYHGTMTPAAGFSSSGNIDMNTGALIVPY